MQAHGIHRQPAHGSAEKQWRSVRRNEELQHNNGMHPTGMSVDVMREVRMLLAMLPGG
jgi:hypothetical protein